ncbi:MAG: hypothetical protein PF485_05060 [Bacteroidales bacterium]|jgi:hypothetical protein|nr:hypothetical protein [Bacteroidales bacterium]
MKKVTLLTIFITFAFCSFKNESKEQKDKGKGELREKEELKVVEDTTEKYEYHIK